MRSNGLGSTAKMIQSQVKSTALLELEPKLITWLNKIVTQDQTQLIRKPTVRFEWDEHRKRVSPPVHNEPFPNDNQSCKKVKHKKLNFTSVSDRSFAMAAGRWDVSYCPNQTILHKYKHTQNPLHTYANPRTSTSSDENYDQYAKAQNPRASTSIPSRLVYFV
jgi:hypothetical protein